MPNVPLAVGSHCGPLADMHEFATGLAYHAAESFEVLVTTTGNQALDALADAIADRVFQRLIVALEKDKSRLLDVSAAAQYIGRSPSALRHLIAKGSLPCVRRDGRVQLDRQDLDHWVELSKTRG